MPPPTVLAPRRRHDVPVLKSWLTWHAIDSEVEEVMRYLQARSPTLHRCPEWDGICIEEGDSEYEVCQCFPKEPKT